MICLILLNNWVMLIFDRSLSAVSSICGGGTDAGLSSGAVFGGSSFGSG